LQKISFPEPYISKDIKMGESIGKLTAVSLFMKPAYYRGKEMS
jgi:hypothetical protein